ncbi:MAG: M23 family metallopeptidase [Sedimentibacter sp.]|uniref:M23 family metallopeptidase n=1 Tax=Sedimentibacter sp. TaxID=1960295 RepID=UPI00298125EF|nr:M23 family metallopeptidase [Sedimentibacter sp.]MDW5299685.1 M23 family metallopeptidase [Sedimentibacter sp.]
MVIKINIKILLLCSSILLVLALIFSMFINSAQSVSANEEKSFIKWVDFRVSYSAMDKALKADINSIDDEVKLNWIEILSYLGTKYGGNFTRYKSKDMDTLINKLKNGESIESLTENLKYYDYYFEAYTAVLEGLVGPYEIQIDDENNPGKKIWVKKYGLKAFSPIAGGYYYNHYDDFGNSRSYGFSRSHLGNDLMGSIGTPIVAVETGRVEALGWNQYGGWRIGIRSLNNKRYYYYAHLRKDHPYVKSLKEGDIVYAGDVIGYLGMTGYSTKENVNNINVPHLHFGMQLIFDESQKETLAEIWIDVYNIVNLLDKNKSPVKYNSETNESERIYNIKFHNIP